MPPSCSDQQFIELFETYGPTETAKQLGVAVRAVLRRRKRLEKYQGEIRPPLFNKNRTLPTQYPTQIDIEVPNGVVLVGSDAHIWPGEPSTAIRAFIQFCKNLRPKAVILNGDVLDLGQISRHQPIGWCSGPMVHEEIEAAQAILHQIEMAAGRGVKKLWTIGNHDIRFETRLATVSREFTAIKGTRLNDHFPNWEQCWSVFLNQEIIIKHRFRGGIHAPHNNLLWAGCSIITGHLHSSKVVPHNDYSQFTRYGVDTGCLAAINSDAFYYLENNPKNWRSGFCVISIKNGRLLMPELVSVWDDKHVEFRGNLVKVAPY